MAEKRLTIEVYVLAGGLSLRMGRDKARLKFKGRTLVGWAKQAGLDAGFKVRVIRKDLVKRCGPLGGIYSALKTTQADAVIFLACDMPLVAPEFLKRLVKKLKQNESGIFTRIDGIAGFPFLLRKEFLTVVESQIAKKEFSLQSLARKCGKTGLIPAKAEQWRFLNVNTPEEWTAAKVAVKQSGSPFATMGKSY